MSYQNIYNLISVLVEHRYIRLPTEPMFSKSQYIHMIVEDVIEHCDNSEVTPFDKDEYAINLMREVKRLLHLLDE